MQLWELNSLSWSVVKAGSGKKSRLLTLHQEQSCDVERRGEIHVVVAVRAACTDFLSLLGQRAEGLFSARGEQIYHDFITAGVSASFAFFFFFLLFHSSSPPFSHVSYVLVKAEKSLTSWVPETKLVGGRSGGTSPCAPPPPSRSAFVQGRGEKRHTEVKIKRNMPLGWSRRGTMQDLTPADGEAPRNAEKFWVLLECRNCKVAWKPSGADLILGKTVLSHSIPSAACVGCLHCSACRERGRWGRWLAACGLWLFGEQRASGRWLAGYAVHHWARGRADYIKGVLENQWQNLGFLNPLAGLVPPQATWGIAKLFPGRMMSSITTRLAKPGVGRASFRIVVTF